MKDGQLGSQVEYLLEPLYGDRVKLVRQAMSEQECSWFIRKGEQLGMGPSGYETRYRNCDRVILEAPAVAEALFARIKGLLRDVRLTRDDAECVGEVGNEEGLWRPLALNPRFRLCRYDAGGHFGCHFDGVFKQGASRSMLTCMFYLNGGFEEGATRFIKPGQELWADPETGLFQAREENVLHSVSPEAGLLLLFHHSILHEGQRTSGEKWILRTDVMYERVTSDSSKTPRQQKAWDMYMRAGELEAEDKVMEAMELYAAACKLDPELDSL